MGLGERTRRLIALFELVEGLLLLGVGLGAVFLLRRDAAELVVAWVTELHLMCPDIRAL